MQYYIGSALLILTGVLMLVYRKSGLSYWAYAEGDEVAFVGAVVTFCGLYLLVNCIVSSIRNRRKNGNLFENSTPDKTDDDSALENE